MTDERVDQMLRVIGCHMIERVVASALAARVGLLIGIALSIDEESVLEIVDAALHRFHVCHGAQMTGHLEAALMGFFHGRAQFVACNLRISLE